MHSRNIDLQFDSGVSMPMARRGAPCVYWSLGNLNPLTAIKKVANAGKSAAVATGHVLGEAASNPWVQGGTAALLAATGVGAPAAAAIMAGLKGGGTLLKPGGNIGAAVGDAAKGAALGGAASLAGSAVRGIAGNGVGGAIDAVKRGLGVKTALGAAGGSGGVDPSADAGAGGAGAGGFDWTQLLKMAGGLGLGVAGAQGYTAANSANTRRDQYLDKQAGIADETASAARDMMAGAKPIRQASESALTRALSTAQQQGAPDLSGLTDTANPFAKKYRPAVPPPPARVM